jgi:hypothetical protein
MPNELEAIVDRMIAAGESDDDIQFVVSEWKNQSSGRDTLKTSPIAKATSISAAPKRNAIDQFQESIASTRLGMNKTVGDVGNDLLDAGVGFAKGAGRTIQMIPGVARGTDALFGLPSGSSAKAMESTNTAQELGGYAEGATELLAGGAVGGARLAGTSVGRYGTALAKNLLPAQRSLPMGTMSAEKLAELTAKYGKEAVKKALQYGAAGLGTGGAFELGRRMLIARLQGEK